jgi:hypothetical protein
LDAFTVTFWAPDVGDGVLALLCGVTGDVGGDVADVPPTAAVTVTVTGIPFGTPLMVQVRPADVHDCPLLAAAVYATSGTPEVPLVAVTGFHDTTTCPFPATALTPLGAPEVDPTDEGVEPALLSMLPAGFSMAAYTADPYHPRFGWFDPPSSTFANVGTVENAVIAQTH